MQITAVVPVSTGSELGRSRREPSSATWLHSSPGQTSQVTTPVLTSCIAATIAS
jgi:hypothetical protein